MPSCLVQANHITLNQLQSIPSTALDLIVKQRPNVSPEQLSGCECPWTDRSPIVAIRLAAQPFQEIVRPVMERAHTTRRNIQDVAGVAGGIGEATTELTITLDQNELDRRRATTQ